MSNAATQKFQERSLKIFCPSHRISFSVLNSGKISCDAGDHALSQNFPLSELWGYCCDCQNFWPANLAEDGTPRHVCVACERDLIRFYLCDTCQVISAESDEPTRRKAFLLPVQSAPQPACPGCLATTSATLRTHDCAELGVSFVTTRLVCPFCEDEIGDPLPFALTEDEKSRLSKDTARAQPKDDVLGLDQPPEDAPGTQEEIGNAHSQSAPVLCPQCGTEGTVEQSFCKNCGDGLGVDARGFPLARDEEERIANSTETVAATPRIAPLIPRYVKGLIVVVVVIAGLLIAAVALRLPTSNSVDSRLDKAISKGALLSPLGESAYDLYHQMKREGTSPTKLASYDDRLLPLLTAPPNQLLTDLADPEKNAETSTAKWEESAKLLTWASEIRPQDNALSARAAYCQGRVAYLNEDKSTALQEWKRANELDKTWALPANHAGLVHTERREFSKARDYLYEAIRREPQWAIPYNNLGTSFYYERNYVQAESYYEQARDRAPRWARPHAWLGDIAMRRADYDRAVQEFEAVLNLATADNSSIKLDEIRTTLERARQKSAEAAAIEE